MGWTAEELDYYAVIFNQKDFLIEYPCAPTIPCMVNVVYVSNEGKRIGWSIVYRDSHLCAISGVDEEWEK